MGCQLVLTGYLVHQQTGSDWDFLRPLWLKVTSKRKGDGNHWKTHGTEMKNHGSCGQWCSFPKTNVFTPKNWPSQKEFGLSPNNFSGCMYVAVLIFGFHRSSQGSNHCHEGVPTFFHWGCWFRPKKINGKSEWLVAALPHWWIPPVRAEDPHFYFNFCGRSYPKKDPLCTSVCGWMGVGVLLHGDVFWCFRKDGWQFWKMPLHLLIHAIDTWCHQKHMSSDVYMQVQCHGRWVHSIQIGFHWNGPLRLRKYHKQFRFIHKKCHRMRTFLGEVL